MTAVATPIAPKQVSRLGNIKPTKLKEPPRVLVYGFEGVGKSSLAADAPAPIFLDIEGGSGHLEVTRYPFRDDTDGHVPVEYVEVLRALDDLSNSDHAFQTVVIDTVDRLESLLWAHICTTESAKPGGKRVENIEGFGYGKGYILAVDYWRALCVKLDRLRTKKRMNVILLGHSQIRTFKSPDTDDFDRYNLRLNDKAAGFLKEWADVTAFACFEDTAGGLSGERVKGVSTGRRLLKLERTAAFDAKTRISLPTEIELDPARPWAPFATAVQAGEESTPAALSKLIDEELKRIGDADLTKKATAACADAVKKNDTSALNRYLMGLKKR